MGLIDALFGSKKTTDQKSTQTTSQTNTGQTSTTIDPTVQNQVYKNIEDANRTADAYTPAVLTGPAGFNQDQLDAFDAARKVGSAGSETMRTGVETATRAAGYSPDQISASTYNPTMYQGQTGYTAKTYEGPTGYTAQGYQATAAGSQGYDAALAEGAQGYQAQQAQAAQINRGNVRDINTASTVDKLPTYLKSFDQSYQQNVIDQALKDLDRSRIMTMQGSDAAAARAGAWGSRRDLLDAETNRGFADAAARATADLRNQGFQTALGALSQDQQRELAASAANQNADTSVFGANAQLQQGTNLANIDAANQAAQFGASSNNAFTLSNQQARNQAAAFGAQAANQAALENAGMANDAAKFTAGAKNDASQFSADMGYKIGSGNRDAINEASRTSADLAYKVGAGNQDATNTAGKFNAGQSQDASLANQRAGVDVNAQRVTAGSALAGMGVDQQNMAATGANSLNKIGTQRQAYDQAVVDTQNENADRVANTGVNKLKISQSGLDNAVYGTTTNSSGTSTGTSTGNSTTTEKSSPSLVSGLGQIIGTGLQVAGLASGMGGTGLVAQTGMKAKSYSPLGVGQSSNGVFDIPNTGLSRGGAVANSPWVPGGRGYTVSDKRLKKNVIRIGSPLKKVHQMTGVNYDWKGGGKDSGLLAQDVEKASPRAVKTIGGIKAYNPAPVLGLLVESVKELDRKVARR